MAKKSRGFNVLINSAFGMLATMVSTIMTFAVRTVLSRSLGEELYGLNTLFSSIITTLLIMELGISTAMTIYLYEPVAVGNKERIKSIIRLYRNVYRIFCGILVFVGLIVDIFVLPYMVRSSLPMAIVRIYFLIFLVSITVKYLWSYKRSLLLANQENRISTGVTAACEATFGLLEILVLIKTRNYYLYLMLLILQNTTSNCICNTVVNRKYKFITERKADSLPKEDKIKIFNTIKPMFVQRIAGVVQDSSIAVILSFMSESVAAVGFYGNYQLVIHTAQSLYSQIGAAFTTSFGNFSATESHEKCYQIYKRSRFIMNWLTAIISICFMTLIQMFIELFFGKTYVLSNVVVILLTVYLYAYLNNIIFVSIQNAMGLHRLDAKQMVFQTILNVILSVVGGFLIGLEGILIGSLVSMFTFSTLYKGCAIYKHVFGQSIKTYIVSLADEYIRFVISGAVVCFLMNWILPTTSVIHWLIRAVVSGILSCGIFGLLSIRNGEMSYVKTILISLKKKFI